MTVAKPNRRYSLRLSLVLLVVVSVLPGVLVSAGLIYQNYRISRMQVDQNTLLISRKVLADFEREMASIEAGLKILSTSPDLAVGDMASFHKRARDALGSGSVLNYILTDKAGRQIVNTVVPYGTNLPTQGTPAQLGNVFSQRTTVLTDLFIGPVTHKPVIAMGVPVQSGDEVTYSLNIGLAPARLNEILGHQNLPEGWLVAIVDQSGTIAARSRDADHFVGQKAVLPIQKALALSEEGHLETVTKEGIPVFTAFSKSAAWRWSVVVGAPKRHLEKDLTSLVSWLVAGTASAFVLGLWLASLLGGRVMSSVRGLNKAATQLRDGQPVKMPEIELKEAEAVGAAILQAGTAIEQVKYWADHDVLTGLANRRLFFELVRPQLAMAARSGSPIAFLALDLDGFKAVNDTDGHAQGDVILKCVAERMAQELRASDAVARFGGDEFVVMLCDTDLENAMTIAKRILVALAKPYPQTACEVSASIGMARFPENGSTLEVILNAADEAMYKAKEQGKNRVVLA